MRARLPCAVAVILGVAMLVGVAHAHMLPSWSSQNQGLLTNVHVDFEIEVPRVPEHGVTLWEDEGGRWGCKYGVQGKGMLACWYGSRRHQLHLAVADPGHPVRVEYEHSVRDGARLAVPWTQTHEPAWTMDREFALGDVHRAPHAVHNVHVHAAEFAPSPHAERAAALWRHLDRARDVHVVPVPSSVHGYGALHTRAVDAVAAAVNCSHFDGAPSACLDAGCGVCMVVNDRAVDSMLCHAGNTTHPASPATCAGTWLLGEDDPCTWASTCAECAYEVCGWCESTGTCLAKNGSEPLNATCALWLGGMENCTANCTGFTDCSECLLSWQGCGWCDALSETPMANTTNTACMEVDDTPGMLCSSDWVDDYCPFNCSQLTDCEACHAEPACGWCQSTRSCEAGRASGPSNNETVCTDWLYDTCPLKCVDVSTCGACNNVTAESCIWCDTTRTCHPGNAGGPTDATTCASFFFETCPTCADYADCDSCPLDLGCGWCDSSGDCMDSGSGGPLVGNCDAWYQSACPVCHNYTTCESCPTDLGCGWCADNVGCISGTSAGPEDVVTCEVGWFHDECPVCHNYTTCALCPEEKGCGWCLGTNTCMDAFVNATTNTSPYPADGPGACAADDWFHRECPICRVFTTCDDCRSNAECGWCDSTDQCINGTLGGPREGECAHWFYDECPACSFYATCAECPEHKGCGWCGVGDVGCHRGDASGPRRTTCDLWMWGEPCPTCATYSDEGFGCGACLDGEGDCAWCHATASCEPAAPSSSDACPDYWDLTCPECSRHTDCASCSADHECGWCGNTNECLPGTASGAFKEGSVLLLPNATCPEWLFDECFDLCTLHTDCADCVADTRVGCGWCDSTQSCMKGTSLHEGPVWPNATCDTWFGPQCACGYRRCKDCLADSGCAWCDGAETCGAKCAELYIETEPCLVNVTEQVVVECEPTRVPCVIDGLCEVNGTCDTGEVEACERNSTCVETYACDVPTCAVIDAVCTGVNATLLHNVTCLVNGTGDVPSGECIDAELNPIDAALCTFTPCNVSRTCERNVSCVVPDLCPIFETCLVNVSCPVNSSCIDYRSVNVSCTEWVPCMIDEPCGDGSLCTFARPCTGNDTCTVNATCTVVGGTPSIVNTTCASQDGAVVWGSCVGVPSNASCIPFTECTCNVTDVCLCPTPSTCPEDAVCEVQELPLPRQVPCEVWQPCQRNTTCLVLEGSPCKVNATCEAPKPCLVNQTVARAYPCKEACRVEATCVVEEYGEINATCALFDPALPGHAVRTLSSAGDGALSAPVGDMVYDAMFVYVTDDTGLWRIDRETLAHELYPSVNVTRRGKMVWDPLVPGRLLVSDAVHGHILAVNTSSLDSVPLIVSPAVPLNKPRGLFFRDDNALFVCESGLDRIVLLERTALTNFSGVSALVAPATGGLSAPQDVVLWSDDTHILVASDNRVLAFHATTGAYEAGLSYTPALVAGVDVADVAITPRGDVAMAVPSRNAVLTWTPGTAASTASKYVSGDDATATHAPMATAWDGDANLMWALWNATSASVGEYSGTAYPSAAPGTLLQTFASVANGSVAVSVLDEVYVAIEGGVGRLDMASGMVARVNTHALAGIPTGLAFVPHSGADNDTLRLLVSDATQARVLVLDVASGEWAAEQMHMKGNATVPRGLAVREGLVYVACTNSSNAVQRFALATGAYVDTLVTLVGGAVDVALEVDTLHVVPAVGANVTRYDAVLGVELGPSVEPGTLSDPVALALSEAGHMFVADAALLQVVHFGLNATGDTVRLVESASFLSDGGMVPSGVAVSRLDTWLYVSVAADMSVRQYQGAFYTSQCFYNGTSFSAAACNFTEQCNTTCVEYEVQELMSTCVVNETCVLNSTCFANVSVPCVVDDLCLVNTTCNETCYETYAEERNLTCIINETWIDVPCDGYACPTAPEGFRTDWCPFSACELHTSCFECTADPACGWCNSTRMCLNGTVTGPRDELELCASYLFGQCDAPVAPVEEGVVIEEVVVPTGKAECLETFALDIITTLYPPSQTVLDVRVQGGDLHSFVEMAILFGAVPPLRAPVVQSDVTSDGDAAAAAAEDAEFAPVEDADGVVRVQLTEPDAERSIAIPPHLLGNGTLYVCVGATGVSALEYTLELRQAQGALVSQLFPTVSGTVAPFEVKTAALDLPRTAQGWLRMHLERPASQLFSLPALLFHASVMPTATQYQLREESTSGSLVTAITIPPAEVEKLRSNSAAVQRRAVEKSGGARGRRQSETEAALQSRVYAGVEGNYGCSGGCDFTLTFEMVEDVRLQAGMSQMVWADESEWLYFYVDVPTDDAMLTFKIETHDASQPFQNRYVEFFLREGAHPTETEWDYTAGMSTDFHFASLNPCSVSTGRWYIGVLARGSTGYNITMTNERMSATPGEVFYSDLCCGGWKYHYVDVPTGLSLSARLVTSVRVDEGPPLDGVFLLYDGCPTEARRLNAFRTQVRASEYYMSEERNFSHGRWYVGIKASDDRQLSRYFLQLAVTDDDHPHTLVAPPSAAAGRGPVAWVVMGMAVVLSVVLARVLYE